MKWLNDIWSAERIKAFEALTLETKGRDAIREQWSKVPPDDKQWLASILKAGRISTLCAPAFVVPALSVAACQDIVERSALYNWEENASEAPAYRIPEVVLREQDPHLEQELKVALFAALAPFLIAIWGRLPDHYASLQLTKYSRDDVSGGNYHIDASADYTAVIALNDDFQGGGTAIVDGLIGEIALPPVPTGYALIFDGRKTLHKGLPVTAGNRRLLTVWAANDQQRIW